MNFSWSNLLMATCNGKCVPRPPRRTDRYQPTLPALVTRNAPSEARMTRRRSILPCWPAMVVDPAPTQYIQIIIRKNLQVVTLLLAVKPRSRCLRVINSSIEQASIVTLRISVLHMVSRSSLCSPRRDMVQGVLSVHVRIYVVLMCTRPRPPEQCFNFQSLALYYTRTFSNLRCML